MSNLYKLLNSNKILKTWCTIYAMFIAINIGISLFNKEYLHSSCFADLFINYQGGFVRRGLLGEFLLYCYHKNVNPYTVAISLSFISYGVITIYMLYQFHKRQYYIGLLSITFLLGGFGANGFEYYRRDFIIIVIFWAVMLLWKKIKLWKWLIIGNILFALTILCYEPFIFFGIPFAVLLTHLKSQNWSRSISSWIPSYITFFMTCLYSGGQHVYDAIWMSTKGFLEEPGVMSFLLDKSTDIMLFHLHINFLNGASSTPSFLVNMIVISCMIYFYVNATAIYSQDTKVRHQRSYLLLLLVFSMICLTPMFTVLSIDYARTFTYAAISSYIIFFTLKEEELQSIFPTKAYYISNKILSTCDKYIKPTKGKILFIMMFVGLSQCTGMGFIESVKSGQIGTILRIIYHHFL